MSANRIGILPGIDRTTPWSAERKAEVARHGIRGLTITKLQEVGRHG